MKIVNKPLVNLEGEPLTQVTEPGKPAVALSVFDVLINCALNQQPNMPLPADQSAKRYLLAVDLHKAKQSNRPVNIDSTMFSKLKEELTKLYSPIAAGQLIAHVEELAHSDDNEVVA